MKNWIGYVAIIGLFATTALTGCANTKAADASTTEPVAAKPATTSTAPDDLRVYFDSGKTGLRPDSKAVLDQAARLFREGNPVVMTVTGLTDSTGNAEKNLLISVNRASTVAKALVARGIPAEHLQIIGKGETDPLVKAVDNKPEAENRVAVITWR
jgi:OOP family OmpA-OmpF porin